MDLLPGWNSDGMIYELLHIGLFNPPPHLLFIMCNIFLQRQFEYQSYHRLIFLGEMNDFVMTAKFNIFNDDLTLTLLIILCPNLQALDQR